MRDGSRNLATPIVIRKKHPAQEPLLWQICGGIQMLLQRQRLQNARLDIRMIRLECEDLVPLCKVCLITLVWAFDRLKSNPTLENDSIYLLSLPATATSHCRLAHVRSALERSISLQYARQVTSYILWVVCRWSW